MHESTMGTSTTDKRAGARIQVIARAAEILRQLALRERGTTLRALAESTGLPRSTVHRIVVALADENLVTWHAGDGVAQLSLGLVSLALSRRQRLSDDVHPHLEALCRKVGETVDLVVMRGASCVFIDHVQAHDVLLVSALGTILPAHCTACGKALLAALPAEEVESLLPQRLEEYTPHTITDRDDLLGELARIRETGLAFDRDEHTDGISALGVVIHDAWGEAAAVTIPVLSSRLKEREQELSRELRRTCDALDLAFGTH